MGKLPTMRSDNSEILPYNFKITSFLSAQKSCRIILISACLIIGMTRLKLLFRLKDT